MKKKMMKKKKEKSGRPCAVKGCPNMLSPLVPERVILCTQHQLREEEKVSLIKDLVEKYSLSPPDEEFLLKQVDGEFLCPARHLGEYLSIPKTTILDWARKKGKKYGGRWCFPAEIAARFIDLHKNWRTVRSVSTQFNFNLKMWSMFCKKGYFGPLERNLSGHLCVHVNYLSNVTEKYKRLLNIERSFNKVSRRLKKIRVAALRQRGGYAELLEIARSLPLDTPSQIAETLGLSLSTVTRWFKKGKIRGKKEGRRWIKC